MIFELVLKNGFLIGDFRVDDDSMTVKWFSDRQTRIMIFGLMTIRCW